MELMEYGSLSDLLHKHKHVELNAKTLHRMALDIVKGMLYLHECGIVHRDLKSSNLLVRLFATFPNFSKKCR
jgi:serine/threonine protein kinase